MFLNDGNSLAIAWMDLEDPSPPGSVVFRDTNGHRVVKEIRTAAQISSLAISPDGSTLLAASGHLNFATGNQIYVIDITDDSPSDQIEILAGHEGGTRDVLWLNNTEFLSLRSRQADATPLILKHKLGSTDAIQSYYPTDRSCSVARFSGRYLVLGEYPGHITVLDRETMELRFSTGTDYPCVFDIDELDKNHLVITTGTQDGNRGAIYSLKWDGTNTVSPQFKASKLIQLDATPTDIYVVGNTVRWCTGNGARVRAAGFPNVEPEADWSVGRWLWFEKKHPTRNEFYIGSDEAELFVSNSWDDLRSAGRVVPQGPQEPDR